jgi:CBS-domain-containing membrane protein
MGITDDRHIAVSDWARSGANGAAATNRAKSRHASSGGDPVRIQSILAQKGSFVAWVVPDATVFEASRLLQQHGVGALLVSTDGATFEGILSERDIARSVADHGERALGLGVRELMTSDVRTCSPTATVDQLMAVMTEHRIRHIPVVDDAGVLAGIISIGDVVKHRVNELEQETRTLHEYIETGR